MQAKGLEAYKAAVVRAISVRWTGLCEPLFHQSSTYLLSGPLRARFVINASGHPRLPNGRLGDRDVHLQGPERGGLNRREYATNEAELAAKALPGASIPPIPPTVRAVLPKGELPCDLDFIALNGSVISPQVVWHKD
jgi:hypothetical protein